TNPVIAAGALRTMIDRGAHLVDVRPSGMYRAGHIETAVWAIRPRLDRLQIAPNDGVILIADDEGVAALAAKELRELVGEKIALSINLDGPAAWSQAGLQMQSTPESPSDSECIDYLFFVHDRHDGNRAAALQYLAWETNLVQQIDVQERAEFRFE
ncbi:MAG: rhodanese-like domain-containing protein, partial [Ideonella sp.]